MVISRLTRRVIRWFREIRGTLLVPSLMIPPWIKRFLLLITLFLRPINWLMISLILWGYWK
ncbi:unnamed protein product [Tuber melanosporum]|uniref:(Perigord truffle) hypothetical protein n=1 Tax=Tuber melanosporum (strain Mel28) TaxID=656061 RepID=D5GAE4_TUBMM|nr:uncharacterized protein GSTUM_00005128001 [Tuber melanosporum]CAZ81401.1 unnamed protein product [Tuber melanosporum]